MQMFKSDEIFLFILKKTENGNGVLITEIKDEFKIKRSCVSQNVQKLYKLGTLSRIKEGKMTRYFSIMSKYDYMSIVEKVRSKVCPKDDQIQNPQMDKFIFSGNKERVTENLYY